MKKEEKASSSVHADYRGSLASSGEEGWALQPVTIPCFFLKFPNVKHCSNVMSQRLISHQRVNDKKRPKALIPQQAPGSTRRKKRNQLCAFFFFFFFWLVRQWYFCSMRSGESIPNDRGEAWAALGPSAELAAICLTSTSRAAARRWSSLI